ncbi:MAG: hypothetical protein C4521_11255 [Actinobacteria bacterium]|nr:MAG: hypothetical protein C4521_11255 [Actinomycetota bacterium]
MLVVLIVLLGLLFGLVFLYVKLSQPPTDAARQAEAKGITWIRSIYGYGKKTGELFNSPSGVAVDSRGRIFAADGQNGRVLVFNRSGRYLGRLGTSGLGRGQINYPQGIDVGPDDSIYVTDTKRKALLVFGSDLKFRDEIHGEEPLACYATNDTIYVVTLGHVVLLDKNLKVLEKWGKRGKAVGEFDFPHGVAVLKNGTVVVSDGNNMRVQALLNGKGEASWVYGAPPESVFTKTRSFGLPGGLAVDESENIYVVDPLRSSIHVLSDKGKELGEYGDVGQGEGQFYFPSDIAYLGDGEFVVSDTFNDRLQIVRISGGGLIARASIRGLWDTIRDFWWCALLLLLLLAAVLFVFFRRRGEAAA